MPKFITYVRVLPTTYYYYFRHQPMRSQLASQPANEEPALFVHIFFWEICPYILQWQQQRQQQRTDSNGNGLLALDS